MARGKKSSMGAESCMGEELGGVSFPETTAAILDILNNDEASDNKELLDIISADAEFTVGNTAAKPQQKAPATFEEAFDMLYTTAKTRGYITEDEILNIGCSSYDVACLTEKLMDHDVIIKEEKISSEAEYDSSRIDYAELFKKVLSEFPELKQFIRYAGKIQAPQKNEWQQLFPQLKTGNRWAYERLFEMYLRVVVKTAWYYYKKYDISFADALQEGSTGLLQAIDKFDITEYPSFPTFIARPVVGYITRNCDLPHYTVFDIPVHIKDNLFKIYDIVSNHQCPECMCKKRKNECETLKDEIMAKLECSLPEAAEYLNLLTEHETEIFDLADEDSESAFDAYVRQDLKRVVTMILQELGEQERLVLTKRYGLEDGEPQTLEEVGVTIGLTRERVRQIEQKALNMLKHPTRARLLRTFLTSNFSSAKSSVVTSPTGAPVVEKYAHVIRRPKRLAPSPSSFDKGWTSADITRLKKLIGKGLSASEIGARLNKSKSAVIGKLRRLGWKFKE